MPSLDACRHFSFLSTSQVDCFPFLMVAAFVYKQKKTINLRRLHFGCSFIFRFCSQVDWSIRFETKQKTTINLRRRHTYFGCLPTFFIAFLIVAAFVYKQKNNNNQPSTPSFWMPFCFLFLIRLIAAVFKQKNQPSTSTCLFGCLSTFFVFHVVGWLFSLFDSCPFVFQQKTTTINLPRLHFGCSFIFRFCFDSVAGWLKHSFSNKTKNNNQPSTSTCLFGMPADVFHFHFPLPFDIAGWLFSILMVAPLFSNKKQQQSTFDTFILDSALFRFCFYNVADWLTPLFLNKKNNQPSTSTCLHVGCLSMSPFCQLAVCSCMIFFITCALPGEELAISSSKLAAAAINLLVPVPSSTSKTSLRCCKFSPSSSIPSSFPLITTLD